MSDYKELVDGLREFASIPEHCENVANCDECSKEEVCLSFTNKRIIEVATQAADAIEELEYALLLMVLQYCTTDDRLLFHEFMSAGENAFAVLGLENGQQEAPLWYKMDRMMQSASERISKKTAPKEEE